MMVGKTVILSIFNVFNLKFQLNEIYRTYEISKSFPRIETRVTSISIQVFPGPIKILCEYF